MKKKKIPTGKIGPMNEHINKEPIVCRDHLPKKNKQTEKKDIGLHFKEICLVHFFFGEIFFLGDFSKKKKTCCGLHTHPRTSINRQ